MMAKQSAKKQEAAAVEPEPEPQATVRVTISLDDGTFLTEDATDLERIPVKGESFEYTHTVTRTGQVVRVEQVDEEGNVTQLTNLSDVDHSLVEPETGDDLDLAEALTSPDEEVAPETEEALAANTEVSEDV